MGIKNKKSFTLIEMVLVIGVLGFTLPLLFSIIFLILRQQTRIYSLQELKRQGDNAFSTIQSVIKQSGVNIINPSITPFPPYPTIIDNCPVYPTPSLTPAPYIFLYDKDGRDFSYYLVGGKIASNSAANSINNYFLTNDKVAISDLQFSCYRSNQFSPPIVWTAFKVSQSVGADPTPASMQYSTKFQLRNY